MLKRKQNEELTFSKFDTDNTGFSHLIWGLAFKPLFQVLVVLAARLMRYVPIGGRLTEPWSILTETWSQRLTE